MIETGSRKRSIQMIRSVRRWTNRGSLFPLILFLQLSQAAFAWQARQSALRQEPDGGYVGSDACLPCHREIYARYKRSSMGRSMSRVAAGGLKNLSPSAHNFNAQMDRHFEISF